jgi:hypothetical protein
MCAKGVQGMKIVWDVVGALVILAGGVWFMQGVGILGGSMMSGQIQWAIYGGLMIIAGAVLLLYVNRRRAH